MVFGHGAESWSFWDEALPKVYPFQREELKALLRRAWDAGEASERQHVLNAPLVGSGHYHAERKSPAAEADADPAADRAARWRLARRTYNAALANPLEEWGGRGALSHQPHAPWASPKTEPLAPKPTTRSPNGAGSPHGLHR